MKRLCIQEVVRPVLFVMLYLVYATESDSMKSRGHTFCGMDRQLVWQVHRFYTSCLFDLGSRYELGNETVAIYQLANRTLVLSAKSRRKYGEAKWLAVPPRGVSGSTLGQYISRKGPHQWLIGRMDGTANGTVFSYSFDGGISVRGRATILTGGETQSGKP